MLSAYIDLQPASNTFSTPRSWLCVQRFSSREASLSIFYPRHATPGCGIIWKEGRKKCTPGLTDVHQWPNFVDKRIWEWKVQFQELSTKVQRRKHVISTNFKVCCKLQLTSSIEATKVADSLKRFASNFRPDFSMSLRRSSTEREERQNHISVRCNNDREQ